MRVGRKDGDAKRVREGEGERWKSKGRRQQKVCRRQPVGAWGSPVPDDFPGRTIYSTDLLQVPSPPSLTFLSLVSTLTQVISSRSNGVSLTLHFDYHTFHDLIRSSYTHYFTIKDWTSPEWQAAWPQLLKDVPSIIEEANIPLAGREDDDEPVIDEDEGIWLNGVEDMGHETLVICEEEAGGFQFVKTARKPYDEVVACILLRAYMLAPKAFELRYVDHSAHIEFLPIPYHIGAPRLIYTAPMASGKRSGS